MAKTYELKDLPSTFYRVSVKCLIFDDQQRLLVAKDNLGTWEIPGGGWSNRESLEDCARREVEEEYGVPAETVGSVKFVYQNFTNDGFWKLCLVVPVTIESVNFTHDNDDLVESRFVTRDEFVHLPFHFNEQAVLEHVDRIWPD